MRRVALIQYIIFSLIITFGVISCNNSDSHIIQKAENACEIDKDDVISVKNHVQKFNLVTIKNKKKCARTILDLLKKHDLVDYLNKQVQDMIDALRDDMMDGFIEKEFQDAQERLSKLSQLPHIYTAPMVKLQNQICEDLLNKIESNPYLSFSQVLFPTTIISDSISDPNVPDAMPVKIDMDGDNVKSDSALKLVGEEKKTDSNKEGEETGALNKALEMGVTSLLFSELGLNVRTDYNVQKNDDGSTLGAGSLIIGLLKKKNQHSNEPTRESIELEVEGSNSEHNFTLEISLRTRDAVNNQPRKYVVAVVIDAVLTNDKKGLDSISVSLVVKKMNAVKLDQTIAVRKFWGNWYLINYNSVFAREDKKPNIFRDSFFINIDSAVIDQLKDSAKSAVAMAIKNTPQSCYQVTNYGYCFAQGGKGQDSRKITDDISTQALDLGKKNTIEWDLSPYLETALNLQSATNCKADIGQYFEAQKAFCQDLDAKGHTKAQIANWTNLLRKSVKVDGAVLNVDQVRGFFESFYDMCIGSISILDQPTTPSTTEGSQPPDESTTPGVPPDSEGPATPGVPPDTEGPTTPDVPPDSEGPTTPTDPIGPVSPIKGLNNGAYQIKFPERNNCLTIGKFYQKAQSDGVCSNLKATRFMVELNEDGSFKLKIKDRCLAYRRQHNDVGLVSCSSLSPYHAWQALGSLQSVKLRANGTSLCLKGSGSFYDKCSAAPPLQMKAISSGNSKE